MEALLAPGEDLLIRALKATNQSIIALPFVYLKDHLRFRDISGFWEIEVRVLGDLVDIVHAKMGRPSLNPLEAAQNADDSDFSFTWKLGC